MTDKSPENAVDAATLYNNFLEAPQQLNNVVMSIIGQDDHDISPYMPVIEEVVGTTRQAISTFGVELLFEYFSEGSPAHAIIYDLTRLISEQQSFGNESDEADIAISNTLRAWKDQLADDFSGKVRDLLFPDAAARERHDGWEWGGSNFRPFALSLKNKKSGAQVVELLASEGFQRLLELLLSSKTVANRPEDGTEIAFGSFVVVAFYEHGSENRSGTFAFEFNSEKNEMSVYSPGFQKTAYYLFKGSAGERRHVAQIAAKYATDIAEAKNLKNF